jgi:hypothetical protein
MNNNQELFIYQHLLNEEIFKEYIKYRNMQNILFFIYGFSIGMMITSLVIKLLVMG